MTQLYRIVRRPICALLAVTALACGLAFAIAPASAGVLQEEGKPNSFPKTLKKAGKSGDHFSITRFFTPGPASLKVTTAAFGLGGLTGDSHIRVQVVNLTTGATLLNKTTLLTFANSNHTFHWNVPGNNAASCKITVTNLSNKNEPLLDYVVK